MANKRKEVDALTDAMGFFIQKNPPAGFNLAYFQLMIGSGRFEEATKCLNDFTQEPREPKELIKIVYDRQSSLVWCVRVVQKGGRYGAENCLTHDKEEPLVEFYDCRYPHTNYGQFVTRYNLSTLLENPPVNGLCLDGGIPDWNIGGGAMQRVMRWLTSISEGQEEAIAAVNNSQ